MFDKYTYNSILNRFRNYRYYYDYFLNHREYPNSSCCDQIYAIINKLPNPNIFHYYLTPTERESYILPYLFSFDSSSIYLHTTSKSSKYCLDHKPNLLSAFCVSSPISVPLDTFRSYDKNRYSRNTESSNPGLLHQKKYNFQTKKFEEVAIYKSKSNLTVSRKRHE